MSSESKQQKVLDERTKQLTHEIEVEELAVRQAKKITPKFSLSWAVLGIPIFVFVLLFVTKSRMVTEERNGEIVRSWKKLRQTTVAVTLVLYSVGFVYTCYRRYNESIPDAFSPRVLLDDKQ